MDFPPGWDVRVTFDLPVHVKDILDNDRLRAEVTFRDTQVVDTDTPVHEVCLWIDGKKTVETVEGSILSAKRWAELELVKRAPRKMLPLMIGSLNLIAANDLLVRRLKETQ